MRGKRFFSGLVSLFMLSVWPLLATAEEKIVDLRVLIDVSGSMKKNDPANLRAPALRLLVGLLPDGSQAGVWSFGEYVNPLVKVGKVDNRWKQKARKASKRINSKELYTDIEQAILTAVADWRRPNPKYNRNVIVLTDGLVDVDKDPMISQESRRRITDEMLPQLAKGGGCGPYHRLIRKCRPRDTEGPGGGD